MSGRGKGSVQGAPVCWRFWAQGPRYPYGILELGYHSATNNRSTGELASRRGNLIILLSNSYAVDKILIFFVEYHMLICW